MLATVSNVWMPRFHRVVVAIARPCNCKEEGENIRTSLTQKRYGKLPVCVESNQEIAIDFAGQYNLSKK